MPRKRVVVLAAAGAPGEQGAAAGPCAHSAAHRIVDAIFSIVRSGCAGRLLPHEFPPWQTTYHYFRPWRLDGTWERIHTALRERLRSAMGRNPQPSAAILGSQSVRTSVVGGVRGCDGPRRSMAANATFWWTR